MTDLELKLIDGQLRLNIPTKRCAHCKLTKLISDFNISRQDKSGRQGYCRTCNRIVARLYKPPKRRKLESEVIEPEIVTEENDEAALIEQWMEMMRQD